MEVKAATALGSLRLLELGLWRSSLALVGAGTGYWLIFVHLTNSAVVGWLRRGIAELSPELCRENLISCRRLRQRAEQVLASRRA
ncbi:hypothetical protein A3J32_01535 [Candidatus Saccharibacteria bacterium RIFCSPLOWO2_02_FULL_46_7]|nr:MAG: hypothetical protein A3J32_01535 [Candidatus Saccharibacteria bacterium RIFCSPLOWO2_02_FULL_46_7]